MHPLSDKDLDRMSREAAEHYDAEPSTAGWDNLEQRLNEVMPQQKEKDRRRLLWWFMLPLLLMSVGLWWMLSTSNNRQPIDGLAAAPQTDASEKNTNPGNQNKDNNNKAIEGKSNVSDQKNKTAPGINPIAPAGEAVKKQQDAKPGEGNIHPGGTAVVSSGKKESLLITNKRTRTDDFNNANKQTPIIVAEGKRNKNNSAVQAAGSAAAGKSITATNLDGEMGGPQSKSPPASADNLQSADKPNPASIIPSALTASSLLAISPAVSKQKTTNTWQIQPLELGIITGIDLSSIHATGSNQPGYSIGLQAGYRFGKRWQVNTGFIFTRKNYAAKAEDFHPPKHYWTNYVELESLDGYCKMWDIPINLRYYLNPGKSWEWFASAGASSYIMRKQQYDYFYYYNNQPTEKSWETSSQSNHWFAVLNLSAGFEKSISKTFSLQAEPYAKLALKGIGFGSMDINSYGLMVGIKYKPVLNKKSSGTGNKMH